MHTAIMCSPPKAPRSTSLWTTVAATPLAADADGSGMTARAQDADTSAYYRRYLTRCAKAGLEVYVIEYGASGALRKKAAAYCADRGWNCWFAKSQNLDSE